jgi:hypothetical protein
VWNSKFGIQNFKQINRSQTSGEHNMTSIHTKEKESLKLQIQKLDIIKKHNDANFEIEIKKCDAMIKYKEIEIKEMKENQSKKRKSTSINLPILKKRKVLHRIETPDENLDPFFNLYETDESPEPDMSGWSELKKKAWKNKTTNPNNFLHFFKPDGEVTKTGKWTEEERDFFIYKIRKQGEEISRWGDFSRDIPGRTGQQCCSYFHFLKKKNIL